MEVYLDHSATTNPCPQAVEACLHAMREEYGNPSSLHKKGFAAQKLVLEAQRALASALACGEDELVFTSGATEADNLALLGAAAAYPRRGKTIVTTAMEHPAVLEPAAALAARGYTVRRLLPGAEGRYTPEQFAEAVDGDTLLVSAMLVNNETGLILPALEIARAVKRKNPNTLFHTDAAQGFLKVPLKLKGSGVDLLSLSGHKVGAPQGVGALFVRKGVRLAPLLYGGGQQNGLRPGTEAVALIAALGAATLARKDRLPETLAQYEALRARLLERLGGILGVTVRAGGDYAPYIVSLSVRGVRSETLLHYLEQHEIYVSSGSACAKGAPSHVLEAAGLDRKTADETLRVSFSPETTPAMIDIFAHWLDEGNRTLLKQR